MNNIGPPVVRSGIVPIFFAALIAVTILGLLLGNQSFLNPMSWAEARGLNVQTQLKYEKEAATLKRDQLLADAQLQAELDTLLMEKEAREQSHTLKMEAQKQQHELDLQHKKDLHEQEREHQQKIHELDVQERKLRIKQQQQDQSQADERHILEMEYQQLLQEIEAQERVQQAEQKAQREETLNLLLTQASIYIGPALAIIIVGLGLILSLRLLRDNKPASGGPPGLSGQSQPVRRPPDQLIPANLVPQRGADTGNGRHHEEVLEPEDIYARL